MAVSILPMPQFRAGQQGYNFAPVAQGLDTIRQQKNQNAMFAQRDDQMALQREQFGAQQEHRNQMLAAQKAKLAQGPARPWWAGPNGEVDPAMAKYRAAGRPTTTVNVNNTAEKAYDKEIGKQRAKHYVEGQSGGRKAQRSLNNLRVMEKSLANPNLYTGTGAGAVQSLKKAAQSLFGVKVSGVADGEVVQNISKQIAVSLKDNLPGPLSDSDRRFLVEMAPGLGNTPEGNRQVIALGMLQKQYEIARSRAASEYARQNGGRIDGGYDQVIAGLEDEYAQKFSGMIGKLRQQGEASPRPPTAGVGDLRKQYGLE